MAATDSEVARVAVFSWVEGFISGLNYSAMQNKPRTFYDLEKASTEQLFALCSLNPSKRVLEAALDLAETLPRKTIP